MIEVLFALGIATFSVLAIVALLPSGLRSTRDTLEESEALDLLSGLVADRKEAPYASASPLYRLPALAANMAVSTNVFFVRDDHSVVVRASEARWRVTCSVAPPAQGSLGPYVAHIAIGWPAASAVPSGSVEAVASFPQP